MFTTERFNRAAAAMSLAMALGTVTMHASNAQAIELPKFTVHVAAPRVTDASVEKIVPGMSESDVETLVGQPERTVRFEGSHTVAWDYDYRSWHGDSTFSVVFDEAGHVVSKISLDNDQD